MEQPEMDSEVIEIASDDLETPSNNDGEEISSEAPEEDLEEIDIDGLKIEIPKSKAEKLKAERLMQADYTRKTQAAAEEMRKAESKYQETVKIAEFNQSFIDDVAEITAIDKQLNSYSQIDFDRLQDADPHQAMRLERQYRQLQEQRNFAVQNLTQKQQQQHLERQQSIAKELQEGQAVLAREIPNWSPTIAKEITDYAVSQGLSSEQVLNITAPAPILLMHKAMLYDKLVKQQAKKSNQSAPSQPVTRITSKSSSASKDPDRMSTDEWMKWRTSQVKKR